MQSYRLNRTVTFLPDKCALYRTEADGQLTAFPLNAPAARCLHLLLMKKELVTQQELYAFAWDDHGVQTTPNNLYQNISLIRKAMASAFELEGEYIITVPRKGFCLNPNIEVLETELPEQPAAPMVVVPNGKLATNWLSKNKDLLLFLLLVIILLCNVALYYGPRHAKFNFSNYRPISQSDTCQFYVSKDLDNKEREKTIVDKMQWVCADGKFNYISGYNFTSPYSVISCTEKLMVDVPAQCTSTFVIEGLPK